MSEYDHFVIGLMLKVLGSDYIPDVIVPVLKGGAMPAYAIAQFHTPVWFSPADVSRSGAIREVLLPMEPFRSYDVTGWEALVVEDDNITNKGLEAVCKALTDRGLRTKTAALFVNQGTVKLADFYAELVEEFPDYPFKLFNSGDRRHFESKRYLLPYQGTDAVTLDLDRVTLSPMPWGKYFEMPIRQAKMEGIDRSRISPRSESEKWPLERWRPANI